MADECYKRKLTAILSADVAGYSRLMREDEEATVRTLTAYRNVLTHLIHQYRGRVVDSPGDNILAEFGSVVDAVNCAVEIQRDLAERNAELPENRRMQFRIGLNLGDVIEDGERIYGDGVNIAARMESMAEVRGVCISGTVYDAIESKIGLEYDFFGEQEVKNIDKPVRAYRVLSFPGAAAHRVIKAKKRTRRFWRNVVLAMVGLLLLGTVLAGGYFYFKPQGTKVDSVEEVAVPLPEKPSLAVLPFDNMSGDPAQEYFSDGMTEDLITDLSQLSGLFVIGRNSTFAYKGKALDIRRIAQELNVLYVLEGSVRRSANRVRVNVQLIDAAAGHHLWAKRYDGQLDDIFDLQDQINQKIVSALAVKLTLGEQSQLVQQDTDNVEVYDNYLKGLEYYRRNTPDDWANAVAYFQKAIKLEQEFGKAHALLARIYGQAAVEYIFGLVSETRWASALGVSYDEAQELADKYLTSAEKNPTSLYYWLASRLSLNNRMHDRAIAEAGQALALEPNNPDILVQMATTLVFIDRPEEAVPFLKRARRLDPNYRGADYDWVTGMASFAMGNIKAASVFFEKAYNYNPDERWYAFSLAVTYAHLGRKQEARDVLNLATLEIYDSVAATTVLVYLPFKNSDVADRFADGLKKAGLR